MYFLRYILIGILCTWINLHYDTKEKIVHLRFEAGLEKIQNLGGQKSRKLAGLASDFGWGSAQIPVKLDYEIEGVAFRSGKFWKCVGSRTRTRDLSVISRML